MTNREELKARLLKLHTLGNYAIALRAPLPINPDGPAAVEAIIQLEAEIARLREGLESLADRMFEARQRGDDWFEIVEFEIAARALLKGQGK